MWIGEEMKTRMLLDIQIIFKIDLHKKNKEKSQKSKRSAIRVENDSNDKVIYKKIIDSYLKNN